MKNIWGINPKLMELAEKYSEEPALKLWMQVSSKFRTLTPLHTSTAMLSEFWLDLCTEEDNTLVQNTVDAIEKRMLKEHPEWEEDPADDISTAVLNNLLFHLVGLKKREPWVPEFVEKAGSIFPSAGMLVLDYYSKDAKKVLRQTYRSLLNPHDGTLTGGEVAMILHLEIPKVIEHYKKFILDTVREEDLAKFMFVMVGVTLVIINEVFHFKVTGKKPTEKLNEDPISVLYQEGTDYGIYEFARFSIPEEVLNDDIFQSIGDMIDSQQDLIMKQMSEDAIRTAPLAFELVIGIDDLWHLQKSDYIVFETIATTVNDVLEATGKIKPSINKKTLEETITLCIKTKIIHYRASQYCKSVLEGKGMDHHAHMLEATHRYKHMFESTPGLLQMWEDCSEIRSVSTEGKTLDSLHDHIVIRFAASLLVRIYYENFIIDDALPYFHELTDEQKQELMLLFFLGGMYYIEKNYFLKNQPVEEVIRLLGGKERAKEQYGIDVDNLNDFDLWDFNDEEDE